MTLRRRRADGRRPCGRCRPTASCGAGTNRWRPARRVEVQRIDIADGSSVTTFSACAARAGGRRREGGRRGGVSRRGGSSCPFWSSPGSGRVLVAGAWRGHGGQPRRTRAAAHAVTLSDAEGVVGARRRRWTARPSGVDAGAARTPGCRGGPSGARRGTRWARTPRQRRHRCRTGRPEPGRVAGDADAARRDERRARARRTRTRPLSGRSTRVGACGRPDEHVAWSAPHVPRGRGSGPWR